MTEEKHYDIAVLGSGPGGYVAALRAAQLGASVALIEKDRIGGTCLNRGCIPSKAMIESVHALQTARNGKEFGFAAENVTPNMPAIATRTQRIVDQHVGGVEQLLQVGKVDVYRGFGKLVTPGTIRVAGEQTSEVRSRNVIIATGSEPSTLPIPGADLPGIHTSDTIWSIQQIPESMVIIGGGVIGVEIAGVFSGLGSSVTVVEMLPMILAGADDEIARRFLQFFKREGVQVELNAKVKEIKQSGNGYEVTFAGQGGDKTLSGASVLMATGRRPYTEQAGIVDVGVQMNGRFVKVNDYLQTSVPGVYAVGDVVGGWMLAHKAFSDGAIAVENALGRKRRVDYRAVPNCIYSHPEIAGVGLTEQELKAEGRPYKTSKFPMTANARATTRGDTRGLIKMLADPETNEILGVHMMGIGVTELIAEMALAIEIEATAEDITATIHPHPTLSEAVHEAALGLLDGPLHIAKARL